MKRIWWPFCLLMLSRRIMCAWGLAKLRRPYAMRRARGRVFRPPAAVSGRISGAGRITKGERTNAKARFAAISPPSCMDGPPKSALADFGVVGADLG